MNSALNITNFTLQKPKHSTNYKFLLSKVLKDTSLGLLVWLYAFEYTILSTNMEEQIEPIQP